MFSRYLFFLFGLKAPSRLCGTNAIEQVPVRLTGQLSVMIFHRTMTWWQAHWGRVPSFAWGADGVGTPRISQEEKLPMQTPAEWWGKSTLSFLLDVNFQASMYWMRHHTYYYIFTNSFALIYSKEHAYVSGKTLACLEVQALATPTGGWIRHSRYSWRPTWCN